MNTKTFRQITGILICLIFATFAKAESGSPTEAANNSSNSEKVAPMTQPNPPKDVNVVNSVDLVKYMGKWHEIALIPQFFQRQCVKDTTAEYTMLENGVVKVFNSCTKEDGERSASEGRARVVDSKTNAKLEVTFVRLFDWIYLFGGDYWVIQLDPDYGYAVVGHPTRKYGWILSRTPSLTNETLKKIAAGLTDQGYDLCQFMTSPQSGGITEKKSLCDYLKNP